MTDDLVKQARDAADLSQIGWTGEGWVTLGEDFVRALANRIEALERDVAWANVLLGRARREALEEAARVAESVGIRNPTLMVGLSDACCNIAAAIRALKEGE